MGDKVNIERILDFNKQGLLEISIFEKQCRIND